MRYDKLKAYTMARQRRSKGFAIGLPSFLKGIRDLLTRNLLAAFTVAVFLLITALSINLFLHTSHYFRVHAVDTAQTQLDRPAAAQLASEILRLCKGKNIFDLDLRWLERSVEASYPDAKSVAVKRVFPDTVGIVIGFRRPVAVVSDGKLYPVDEELFVLPPAADPRSIKDLPIILGVDVRLEGRRGRKHDIPGLRAAIALLKEARRARFIQQYGIATIDAGDIKSMTFYFKNGLEVRIGCEDLAKRLEALKKVLKDPRLLIDKVQYIDLRFEDVVIGPK